MQFCLPKKKLILSVALENNAKNKHISWWEYIPMTQQLQLRKYPRESCINVHQDSHQEPHTDALSGTNHSRVKVESNVNVHEQEKG